MYSKIIPGFLGVVILSAASGDGWTQEWKGLKFIGGFSYSDGDYGNQVDTNISYLPITVKYQTGPWTMGVTTAYMELKGPDNVFITGSGPIVAGDSASGVDSGSGALELPPPPPPDQADEVVTESGIGDMTFELSYSFERWYQQGLFIDLTGKIKLPTADENKRLGTGEIDYIAQLDIAKTSGGFTPFGTLGYKVIGSPEDITLNNVWFGSLGLQYRFTTSVGGGIYFDYQQATTSTADDLKELLGYVNFKLDDDWSLNLYGVTGFSDSSPNTGLGLQLTYSIK